MSNIASNRLEDALQTYEDLCLMQEALSLSSRNNRGSRSAHPPLSGGAANWRRLRSRLLDNEYDMLSNASDWLFSAEFKANSQLMYNVISPLEDLPLDLYMWVRQSRRIFAVSPDLQRFTVAGNYGHLKWDNVLFPFPSFLVELETPIVEGGVKESALFDAFLVTWLPLPDTNDGPNRQLKIRLFHRKKSDRKGILTQPERNTLQRDLDRRNWVRLAKEGQKTLSKSLSDAEVTQGSLHLGIYERALHGLDICVEPKEILEAMHVLQRALPGKVSFANEKVATESTHWRHYSEAAKIAIGLSLYLVHMSTNSEPAEWKQPKHSRPGPLNAITDGTYICEVVGKGIFDPTIFHPEGGGKLRSGFEMPPHFRRAHKRRPAGSAPNAPKTIEVPSTFIHKDRMPPSGVAGGTRTEVRFDDYE